MLLYGKPVANQIKNQQKKLVSEYFSDTDKYMAILFFGDNISSKVYVSHKQKYGEEIGLLTKVFGQEKGEQWNKNKIFELINDLNNDNSCVGIMVQLPLPEYLSGHKNEILSMITPSKDVDGLGGTLVGKSFFDMVSFTPATPKAVMFLLDYYNLGDLRNKKIAIIGQSTIVGKPLALECLKRKAQIACFDIDNTTGEIKSYTKNADYIFSATGQTHLIDETYIGENGNQIVIDIGYGHKDGKAVGDVNFEKVEKKVQHITPVPGGVGPLTIVALFSNILDLWKEFHIKTTSFSGKEEV